MNPRVTVKIVIMIIILMLILLLFVFDLHSSPLRGEFDATHIGTVDMVVSWAGLPTVVREQAKQKYIMGADKHTIDNGPERFGYCGELPILIRRAFVYGSPWLRNIHIVMPDECEYPEDIIRDAPGILYDPLHLRVRIHRDSSILPLDALPCFSGHPKEANLDRIPGLSEQFVYSNDDTFLNRPIPPEFFFSTDGRPRYRPSA